METLTVPIGDTPEGEKLDIARDQIKIKNITKSVGEDFENASKKVTPKGAFGGGAIGKSGGKAAALADAMNVVSLSSNINNYKSHYNRALNQCKSWSRREECNFECACCCEITICFIYSRVDLIPVYQHSIGIFYKKSCSKLEAENAMREVIHPAFAPVGSKIIRDGRRVAYEEIFNF